MRSVSMNSTGINDASAVVSKFFGESPLEVRPLNEKRSNSFFVFLKSGRYKAFRCVSHSDSELVFQLLVCLASTKRPSFPCPVGVLGEWVFVDWVEGSPLKESRTTNLCKEILLDGLVEVHAKRPSDELVAKELGNPYLARLVERAWVASSCGIGRYLKRLCYRLTDVDIGSDCAPSFLHTDLTVDNVVVSSDGAPCIIDNEALTIGTARALDAWISAASLFPLKKGRKLLEFVEQYDKRLPGSDAVENADQYLGLMWTRKALKSYQSSAYLKSFVEAQRALRLI